MFSVDISLSLRFEKYCHNYIGYACTWCEWRRCERYHYVKKYFDKTLTSCTMCYQLPCYEHKRLVRTCLITAVVRRTVSCRLADANLSDRHTMRLAHQYLGQLHGILVSCALSACSEKCIPGRLINGMQWPHLNFTFKCVGAAACLICRPQLQALYREHMRCVNFKPRLVTLHKCVQDN